MKFFDFFLPVIYGALIGMNAVFAGVAFSEGRVVSGFISIAAAIFITLLALWLSWILRNRVEIDKVQSEVDAYGEIAVLANTDSFEPFWDSRMKRLSQASRRVPWGKPRV